MKRILVSTLFLFAFAVFAYSQSDVVSTREMDRINWMEFKETVPSKIKTVFCRPERSNRTA